MREFFRGWRRMAGCVALVTALAVCMVWVRSRFACDEIRIPRQGSCVVLRSYWNRLYWERFSVESDRPSIEWSFGSESPRLNHSSYHRIDRDWSWSGFYFRTARAQPYAIITADGLTTHQPWIEYWIVPHWACLWPLMILSAYLILWQGKRVTKQVASPHQSGTDDA